jgi:tryptophanyl-tRNA synthetase
MSLTDPTSKMSKSHPQQRSRILITDTPDEIRNKVSRALTDSLPGISYDIVNRPGISNLLDMLSTFDMEGRSADELSVHFADLTPKQLKEIVADAIITGLQGVRSRYLELSSRDDAYLDSIEAEGARKARESAEETMNLVKTAIGLQSPVTYLPTAK